MCTLLLSSCPEPHTVCILLYMYSPGSGSDVYARVTVGSHYQLHQSARRPCALNQHVNKAQWSRKKLRAVNHQHGDDVTGFALRPLGHLKMVDLWKGMSRGLLRPGLHTCIPRTIGINVLFPHAHHIYRAFGDNRRPISGRRLQ